ncbi:MAG: polysaccharide deacetylase family protein [Oscillospiraceae bacterium]
MKSGEGIWRPHCNSAARDTPPPAFQDLQNYVELGQELPEKPVLITFDDGYESNYMHFYPLLQKYQMKATIFPILVVSVWEKGTKILVWI